MILLPEGALGVNFRNMQQVLQMTYHDRDHLPIHWYVFHIIHMCRKEVRLPVVQRQLQKKKKQITEKCIKVVLPLHRAIQS